MTISKSAEQVSQGISLILLSFPFSILLLSYFEKPPDTIIVGMAVGKIRNVFFTCVSLLLFLNLSAYFISRIDKISRIGTGVFLFVAGIAHTSRLITPSEFTLIGTELPIEISWVGPSILIPFSIWLIILGFQKTEADSWTLISIYGKFRSEISKLPPYSAILAGIICSIFIAIPIVTLTMLVALNIFPTIGFFEESEIYKLAWIGIVGAQGSVVSMFFRLRELGQVPRSKSFRLFINSAIKPFIGLSLAHLSYFLLMTGLISLPKTSDNEIYYFVILAFIVGFSERFSKDILLPTDKGNDILGQK